MSPHAFVAAPGRALAAALGLALALPVSAKAVETEWVEAWRSDLAAVVEKLAATHPDPFGRVSRDEVAADISALAARVPELEHHQIVIELARVLARLGDGHTRVTLPLAPESGFFLGHSKTAPPEIPGLLFSQLPVRFAILEDGLHVLRAAPEMAALAGARVVSLGGLTAEEAMDRVAPVVHRDNAHQLAFQLPDYLAIPEVLHATGVGESLDRIELEIETAAGERRSVELVTRAGDDSITWAEAYPVERAPLYLARRDELFWFTEIDGGRTVYLQINEVTDGPEETLAEFCDRVFAVVARDEVERLVLDLRWNRGGGNHLNRALLHHLIRSEKLERPGSFFVITGGGTFSAAMMLAVDLERHTQAVFVGAPTGSSPNHHGDSRKIRLPATGLTLRISTLYWQYSGPRDRREAIRPHLEVGLDAASYRQGIDPVLALLGEPGERTGSEWAKRWTGRASVSRLDLDLPLELRREGDRAAGTLAVPYFDMAAMPLVDLRVSPEGLSFRLSQPRLPLELEGRFENGRIYALATARGAGRWYPVVFVPAE